MLYKDIKIGNVYKTRSIGYLVKVKITGKKRTKNFYKLEYQYVDEHPFGYTTGWQFSESFNFSNVSAVD